MGERKISVDGMQAMRRGEEPEAEDLVKNLVRWTAGTDQKMTSIPGLSLFRREEVSGPASGRYDPGVCLLVQGTKRVFLGKETYQYDAEHYLITAVHLPTIVQVVSASREKPCLGLRLDLDRLEISRMMSDTDLPAPRLRPSGSGMAIGRVTSPLLNAFRRLVDLLDEPADIPILSPVIRREIVYRLLVGEQGERLRQIASEGSPTCRIAKVIDWLKENYKKSVQIDVLAHEVQMGRSTFHHHFRSMTGISPLQFQKRLRLQEARRLMFVERLDAATASLEVGYESSSQFSRDYRRLFGSPPLRDVSSLRLSSVSENP